MTATTVPFRRFSTDFLPHKDRFSAWREAMTTVYEIAPLEEEIRARFTGTATSSHLGPVIIGTMDVDALAYDRTLGKIRSDHMDHFIIRLDRAQDSSGMDQVLVKDMGQPIALPSMRLQGACLFIPRDIMTAMLPRADALHGTRIGGVMGRLLADHIRALSEAAPSLTTGQAPHVVRAIQEMVTACLKPSHDSIAEAKPQIQATLIMQARRYIDARLADPELSADGLCLALGLSRSALYQLFEPHQGVARYIQNRRLARVREILSDPTEQRRIGDIAFAFGFGSEAHFSRAFRRAFGCTPSEARAERTSRAVAGSRRKFSVTPAGEFPDWLRQLRA